MSEVDASGNPIVSDDPVIDPKVDPTVGEGEGDPTPPDKGEDLGSLYDTENFKVNQLNVPDGFTEESIKEIASLAKEQGLNQIQTQALLDRESQKIAEFQGNPENWVELLRNDKEIGGKDFEVNIGIARKAVASFDDPELNRILNDSGVGSHPSIVKAFFKIGQAIANDSFITGKSAPAKEKTPAERLYG